MKKYLSVVLLLNIAILSQPFDRKPGFKPELPFQSEIISIQNINDEYNIYYTFKLPYKMLVFERVENSFIASFRVVIEVTDESLKLVTREIKDCEVSVSNFEFTNSQKLYLEDLIIFNLAQGNYKITAIISDLNSTDEIKLEPQVINLNALQNKTILNPIVINSGKFKCNNSEAMSISISGNKIPFSQDNYDLIIPIQDTSIEMLSINVLNNKEQIFSGNINESFIKQLGILKCNEKIVLTLAPENKFFKYFIFKNINEKIKEGELTIKIVDEIKKINEEYKLSVIWLNKPFSLSDPEHAIEFLNYVEEDSTISSLLELSDSDYLKTLDNYWVKLDPTPGTAFNEIMFEYYSRVDYAIQEFRGLNKDNGAKSDRGIVYIRYGHPEKIERSSNPQGLILETWNYINPERKFIFIDKKGTGNFTLVED